MRDFLRAYNYTLVPVVGVLVFLCSVYIHFSQQISIEKAIKLGTLYGFFIGLVVNIFAGAILLWRVTHPSKTKSKKRTKQSKNARELSTVTPTKIPNTQVSTFLKEMYLLVDKEMAFDISLQAIMEHSLGTPSDTNKHRGFFSLRTKNQTIDFEIQPLTRHTSKLNIKTQKRSDVFDKILKYIKEKELSILSY